MMAVCVMMTFILLFNVAACFTLPTRLRLTRLNELHINSIKDASAALFEKVNTALALKETDYTASKGLDKFNRKDISGNEWSGSSGWFDETRGSKLTGVSKFELVSFEASRYHMDCWLGPGLMVPHLTLSIGSDKVDSSGHLTYSIRTDYIPRGPFPFGSDPSYITSFYQHEVDASVATRSTPALNHRNFHSPSSKLSFYHRLIQSPAYFSANNLTEELVIDLSTKHVDRWLLYVLEAKPLDTRQKAGYNVRDDKLRQFAFAANLYEYSALFGPDLGRSMAMAFTGPVAEAYVGGGS